MFANVGFVLQKPERGSSLNKLCKCHELVFATELIFCNNSESKEMPSHCVFFVCRHIGETVRQANQPITCHVDMAMTIWRSSEPNDRMDKYEEWTQNCSNDPDTHIHTQTKDMGLLFWSFGSLLWYVQHHYDRGAAFIGSIGARLIAPSLSDERGLWTTTRAFLLLSAIKRPILCYGDGKRRKDVLRLPSDVLHFWVRWEWLHLSIGRGGCRQT